MLVANAMTDKVHCITPSCTLLEAAGIMASKNISGLVVVNDQGQIKGVLSEEDLFPRIKNQAAADGGWPMLYSEWAGDMEMEAFLERVGVITVSEIMTGDVVSISPEDQLAAAAIKMANNSIKRLPVVDDDGKLVGIITATDIVGQMARYKTERSSERNTA